MSLNVTIDCTDVLVSVGTHRADPHEVALHLCDHEGNDKTIATLEVADAEVLILLLRQAIAEARRRDAAKAMAEETDRAW